jgi:hypothetical protein
VTIEDIPDDVIEGAHSPRALSAIVNSPRSVDACRRQGIQPEELLYKSIFDFKKTLGLEANTLRKDQIQMRWNHLEQRRREKIKVIKEERSIIVMEEANGEWNPPALSGMSNGSSGKKGVSMQMGGLRATTSG